MAPLCPHGSGSSGACTCVFLETVCVDTCAAVCACPVGLCVRVHPWASAGHSAGRSVGLCVSLDVFLWVGVSVCAHVCLNIKMVSASALGEFPLEDSKEPGPAGVA